MFTPNYILVERVAVKKISFGLVTVALTSSLILIPSVAMATPTNCSATESGLSWTGTCTGGTGSFRIRLDCNNWPDQTSPWTPIGRLAVASCMVEHARGYTFEVRG